MSTFCVTVPGGSGPTVKFGFVRYNHAVAKLNHVYKISARKGDIFSENLQVYIMSVYVGNITSMPVRCDFRPSFLNHNVIVTG